jgi:hypothetical protein
MTAICTLGAMATEVDFCALTLASEGVYEQLVERLQHEVVTQINHAPLVSKTRLAELLGVEERTSLTPRRSPLPRRQSSRRPCALRLR